MLRCASNNPSRDAARHQEQVANVICRMLTIDLPAKYDATDGMAVALCHYFATASPLNAALGNERVKGLGGGKKQPPRKVRRAGNNSSKPTPNGKFIDAKDTGSTQSTGIGFPNGIIYPVGIVVPIDINRLF